MKDMTQHHSRVNAVCYRPQPSVLLPVERSFTGATLTVCGFCLLSVAVDDVLPSLTADLLKPALSAFDLASVTDLDLAADEEVEVELDEDLADEAEEPSFFFITDEFFFSFSFSMHTNQPRKLNHSFQSLTLLLLWDSYYRLITIASVPITSMIRTTTLLCITTNDHRPLFHNFTRQFTYICYTQKTFHSN